MHSYSQRSSFDGKGRREALKFKGTGRRTWGGKGPIPLKLNGGVRRVNIYYLESLILLHSEYKEGEKNKPLKTSEKGCTCTAPCRSCISKVTFFDLSVLFLKKETVKMDKLPKRAHNILNLLHTLPLKFWLLKINRHFNSLSLKKSAAD